MDEAMALPTDKAARIALRTQQVIAHETGVASVADPLGGSWFVEELTDDIERRANEIFDHLLASGNDSMLEGVYAAIDDGWFQGQIADAAYDFEKKVNANRRVVVGVNAFTDGNDDDDLDLLRITNEHEQAQIKRLQAVKADRDTNAVHLVLERVRETARDPEANLMSVLIDAVQQYATEGEIMDALADVFGRYVETPVL
jgi:methylmalonyl-CoA mutase N-terminal domain/subunit